jgi:hypothetical protein
MMEKLLKPDHSLEENDILEKWSPKTTFPKQVFYNEDDFTSKKRAAEEELDGRKKQGCCSVGESVLSCAGLKDFANCRKFQAISNSVATMQKMETYTTAELKSQNPAFKVALLGYDKTKVDLSDNKNAPRRDIPHFGALWAEPSDKDMFLKAFIQWNLPRVKGIINAIENGSTSAVVPSSQDFHDNKSFVESFIVPVPENDMKSKKKEEEEL